MDLNQDYCFSTFLAQLCFSSLLTWASVEYAKPNLAGHSLYRGAGIMFAAITGFMCLAKIILMMMESKENEAHEKKKWLYKMFKTIQWFVMVPNNVWVLIFIF